MPYSAGGKLGFDIVAVDIATELSAAAASMRARPAIALAGPHGELLAGRRPVQLGTTRKQGARPSTAARCSRSYWSVEVCAWFSTALRIFQA